MSSKQNIDAANSAAEAQELRDADESIVAIARQLAYGLRAAHRMLVYHSSNIDLSKPPMQWATVEDAMRMLEAKEALDASTPRCPKCGYSELDADLYGDHYLCDGTIPRQLTVEERVEQAIAAKRQEATRLRVQRDTLRKACADALHALGVAQDDRANDGGMNCEEAKFFDRPIRRCKAAIAKAKD